MCCVACFFGVCVVVRRPLFVRGACVSDVCLSFVLFCSFFVDSCLVVWFAFVFRLSFAACCLFLVWSLFVCSSIGVSVVSR